jgi:hypothetical protein
MPPEAPIDSIVGAAAPTHRGSGDHAWRLDDPALELLAGLGFARAEIDVANSFCCGASEGTPHLKPEHLAVFDCANPCDRTGTRALSVDSQHPDDGGGAALYFGAISKTINKPNSATVEDCKDERRRLPNRRKGCPQKAAAGSAVFAIPSAESGTISSPASASDDAGKVSFAATYIASADFERASVRKQCLPPSVPFGDRLRHVAERDREAAIRIRGSKLLEKHAFKPYPRPSRFLMAAIACPGEGRGPRFISLRLPGIGRIARRP